MSKFFVILLIISLILSTALIKNSTKRLDDEIFVLKENIRDLKKDFGNPHSESHAHTAAPASPWPCASVGLARTRHAAIICRSATFGTRTEPSSARFVSGSRAGSPAAPFFFAT